MPQLSLHSPIGDLTVSEDGGTVVALDWGWGRDQSETPLLRRARLQLQAYFDGEPVDPGLNLPLAPAGTLYCQRVWLALRRIPPGASRSYTDMATESADRRGPSAKPLPPILFLSSFRAIGSWRAHAAPVFAGSAAIRGTPTPRPSAGSWTWNARLRTSPRDVRAQHRPDRVCPFSPSADPPIGFTRRTP